MKPIALVSLETVLGPIAPAHWSEVVMGFIFAVLIAIAVQKFVVPKFEETYNERANEIEGGIRRSEQAQIEASETKQRYQDLLEQARSDSAGEREKAREQAAQIVAEARAQAQREADRMIEQAKQQIESERQQALQSLRQDIGGLATTLAGRIVAESLEDNERTARTVDRFLAELENEPSRTVPDNVAELGMK